MSPISLEHNNIFIQFNGIIDCWRKTIQQNGVLAIYSGMSICLIGDVVYRGLKYTFYDFFKVSSFIPMNWYKSDLSPSPMNGQKLKLWNFWSIGYLDGSYRV